MASLMKMVVSLPLRLASSLFLLSLLSFLLLFFISVSPLLLLVAALMVAEWRCWMVWPKATVEREEQLLGTRK
jgi:hypothetical protein